MVDFKKMREQNKQRLAEEHGGATITKKLISKSELELVNDCLECEVTEWANNFLLSIKEWLRRKEGNYCSFKQRAKLLEIADEMGVAVHRAAEDVEPKAVPAPNRTQPVLNKHDEWDDIDDDISF